MAIGLPSWMKQHADQRTKARPVPVSMDADDGWKIVGRPLYTCVRPADQPAPDQSMLANVHAFDRSIVPIWEKRQYIPPGETKPVVIVRAGLARHVPDPKGARYLMHVEMPTDADFEAPNILDPGIFEARDKTLLHHGGPGAYKPLDGRIYRYLRARYDEAKSAKQRAREYMAALKAQREKQLRVHADKLAYIERDFEKYAGKKLETATVREFREYRRKRAAEARGERERKPFVQMTGASA